MAQKTNRRKTNKPNHPLIIFFGLLFIVLGLFTLTRGTTGVSVSSILPNAISQEEFSQQAQQDLKQAGISTPLLLQTDERWSYNAYGSGENNDIAHNGCALLSLSMVLSKWRGQTIDPNEIFQWAGDRYFVAGQGTAWSIFPAFAEQYQLNYHDLGTDFSQVEHYLDQNIPVIASVTAGEFTDGGHILVLAARQNQKIRLLDPNDTPEKMHYQKEYEATFIQQQAIHYWTYTR